MAQNLIERIAQKFSVDMDGDHEIFSGDYISISPSYVMTHDNTGAVIPKFLSIGATKMANARQIVFALDHNIQDTSEGNLQKYEKIKTFSNSMGVDFYPAGRGIGHQIMIEEGYAWPGTMVVASDSHSNMYGGIGCLGTPIVRTDAAAIWATGRTWWQIPPVARVELKGKLQNGVKAKDIIIGLCAFFNNDEVLNHALEFCGDGIRHLEIEQRLTIANMTTEWGALAGVFPIDEQLIQWYQDYKKLINERGVAGTHSIKDGNDNHSRINDRQIQQLQNKNIKADPDAKYVKELTIDLSTLQPYVSGPNTVKKASPISEIKRQDIRIDKAYLVSCVNSRVEDITDAALMVKGKKIADGVKFYIAAASSEVQNESEKRGDWQILLQAGAISLPPGCGPCIGLGSGLLKDGEIGISATNRNYKGRMGSRNADTYLASPAVVAASAVAGKIDYPGIWDINKPAFSIKSNKPPAEAFKKTELISGFPHMVTGNIIFCPQDNINTDGIYPGKYTYIDDFSPQQQANVVMENYDPEFSNLVANGDILVGGLNFGSGSSREQAATALKYRGIQVVIAGSFSETYKRNAINNGFLVIEVPDLVTNLKKIYGKEKLTIKTGLEAHIDFFKSEITVAKLSYKISPIGKAAQELIIADGLENWVRQELKQT